MYQMDEAEEIFHEQGWEWIRTLTLGGSFTKVHIGQMISSLYRNDLVLVALKVVDTKGNKVGAEIEASIARSLLPYRNPFLVNIYGVWELKTSSCIAMEYCPGGDLLTYVHSVGVLADWQACKVLRQLCFAVDFLHHRNITHCDIKCENILIGFDGNIRLSDFDWCRSRSVKLVGICGTEGYCPPEAYHSAPYWGEKVDIWTIGVVLYFVKEARLPFEHKRLVNASSADLPLVFHKHISPDVRVLVEGILRINPAARPSLIDLINYPLQPVASPPAPAERRRATTGERTNYIPLHPSWRLTTHELAEISALHTIQETPATGMEEHAHKKVLYGLVSQHVCPRQPSASIQRRTQSLPSDVTMYSALERHLASTPEDAHVEGTTKLNSVVPSQADSLPVYEPLSSEQVEDGLAPQAPNDTAVPKKQRKRGIFRRLAKLFTRCFRPKQER